MKDADVQYVSLPENWTAFAINEQGKNTLLQFRGRIFDLSEGIHSSVSHRVGKTDVRGPHLDLFVCWPPDIVYSLAQDNTKEFVMDGTRVGKRSNSSKRRACSKMNHKVGRARTRRVYEG